jgi:AcrR family transcriptional regulator
MSPVGNDAARDRIVQTAYDLFARNSIQSVGVDRIVAEAGVAKSTLYRHFRSKDALVLAVLELHQNLWTHDWLEGEIARRGGTPDDRLLAIFEAFDEWFRREGFAGCLFMNSLLETSVRSPVGAASALALADVRAVVRRLADEAGFTDPDGFTRRFHLVMEGAIMRASEGHADAALEGRNIARLLLQNEPRRGASGERARSRG